MECRKIIDIIPATIDDLQRCSKILEQSELGQKYFVNSNGEFICKELLKEGFDNNEIHISKINDSSEIIGFSWIQPRGMFHWFPFLHVVVISKKYQGMGYGRRHMEHFESLCSKEYKVDKAFLIVSEDNERAIGLYQHLGYKNIGNIPSLFIKDIDEVLMYKDIK